MQQENLGGRNWHYLAMAAFGIIILLRLLLSSRLPSYILAGMPHDDGWVVSRALYILNGQWLGPYDQYTLIKGAFSPLLLAFSSLSGFTFSGLNAVLYCAACVVFVVAARPISKNPWLQVFLLLVLLFNPISYALETSQRIYRNGIGQWQILLIIACLLALFLRRNESWKGLIIWALAGGLSLGAFLQTREDGAWLYPLVVGAAILTGLMCLLERKGPKLKVALYFIPIAVALSLTGATAMMNNHIYGAPVVNDRNDGNYAKVAGDLYAIKPKWRDEELYESDAYRDRYYTLYVSTMKKAFAASPTLKSASKQIRSAIKMWASWEQDNIGEVSTDHMLFALRDGVRAAGYYQSLPETEAFYGRVHAELQAAFEDGRLKKHGFAVSPLIKRVQARDVIEALSILPTAIAGIADFRNVSSRTVPSFGSATGIKEVDLLAGGEYYTSRGSLSGSGWAFAEDDKTQLSAGLYDDQGALIAALAFHSGDDVFQATKFENAKMSRFSFSIEGYDLASGVTIRFYDAAANLVGEIPADGSAVCGGTEGVFRYCMDNLRNDPSSEQFYDGFVARANRVIAVYQAVTPILSVLALLVYLASTIMVISEARNKQTKTLPVWLALTGVGSTFLLFMASMSIITATSFNSITYLYTAPGYLLLLIFVGISLLWVLQSILEIRKPERR